MSTGSELEVVLGGLERASRGRLAQHWQEYFGAPPPPRTSRSLLVRAVAYKMQERALGGLSPATRQVLCGDEPAPGRRTRSLPPGTVLIRDGTGLGIRSRSARMACSIVVNAMAPCPKWRA